MEKTKRIQEISVFLQKLSAEALGDDQQSVLLCHGGNADVVTNSGPCENASSNCNGSHNTGACVNYGAQCDNTTNGAGCKFPPGISNLKEGCR